VWVCGRCLAGIDGSNPAGGMDFSLLWVLCVVRHRSLRRADHSYRGVLPSVACLNVIVKPRQWGGPGPVGSVVPWRKSLLTSTVPSATNTVLSKGPPHGTTVYIYVSYHNEIRICIQYEIFVKWSPSVNSKRLIWVLCYINSDDTNSN
jgi:hypothetical protein